MGETPAVTAVLADAEHRIRTGERFVRCDLGSVANAGLDLVDRLARLRLDARRRHCRLEIRTADAELVELLELAGLDGVVLIER
ncbi:MAG: hypothetical protein QOC82_1610 [Frankiaceae bacterium]|jgi:hypothetical protein|nr:hypothetical protein [Frankiaceae bacterium]